jgi:Asp-tRNA(Asn)/Glu-tRNA(Gln) amidotransferase A subunit family amidase
VEGDWITAAEIAAAVMSGRTSALSVIDDTLTRIKMLNPKLNAFTAVIAERAVAKARAVDAVRDKSCLPLAGVPFAVKNLFDIEGVVTVAGSKINRAYSTSPARTYMMAPHVIPTT